MREREEKSRRYSTDGQGYPHHSQRSRQLWLDRFGIQSRARESTRATRRSTKSFCTNLSRAIHHVHFHRARTRPCVQQHSAPQTSHVPAKIHTSSRSHSIECCRLKGSDIGRFTADFEARAKAFACAESNRFKYGSKYHAEIVSANSTSAIAVAPPAPILESPRSPSTRPERETVNIAAAKTAGIASASHHSKSEPNQSNRNSGCRGVPHRASGVSEEILIANSTTQQPTINRVRCRSLPGAISTEAMNVAHASDSQAKDRGMPPPYDSNW